MSLRSAVLHLHPTLHPLVHLACLATNGTFSYTVTLAGTYSYKCGIHPSMTASFTATVATDVLKPSLIVSKIYPNPSVETISIESEKIINTVEIYSETGLLIKTLNYSDTKIDVSVNDLQKGIYYIKVISDSNTFDTRRIIKM